MRQERLEYAANSDSQAPLYLRYDRNGLGLNQDFSMVDRISIFYLFDDSGIAASTPVTMRLSDGTDTATLTLNAVSYTHLDVYKRQEVILRSRKSMFSLRQNKYFGFKGQLQARTTLNVYEH